MLDSEGLLLLLGFDIVGFDVFCVNVGRDTGVGVDDDDGLLLYGGVGLKKNKI